jgi:hypothetical protein
MGASRVFLPSMGTSMKQDAMAFCVTSFLNKGLILHYDVGTSVMALSGQQPDVVSRPDKASVVPILKAWMPFPCF